MIKRPKTQAELESILRGKSAVLEIGIPHCSMCSSAEKILDKISIDFPEIAFAQVSAAAKEFEIFVETRGIRAVPVLLFLCDGVELAREGGGSSEKIIRQKIKTFLCHGGEK